MTKEAGDRRRDGDEVGWRGRHYSQEESRRGRNNEMRGGCYINASRHMRWVCYLVVGLELDQVQVRCDAEAGSCAEPQSSGSRLVWAAASKTQLDQQHCRVFGCCPGSLDKPTGDPRRY